MGDVEVEWGGLCRGEVGYTRVGLVMYRWVGHVGVGWVL